MLSGEKGGRILALSGAWPTQQVETPLGRAIVADLLVR